MNTFQGDNLKILEHNENILHGGINNRFQNFKNAAVVTLKAQCGHTLKEIAEMLELNENTARSINAVYRYKQEPYILYGWDEHRIIKTYWELKEKAENNAE